MCTSLTETSPTTFEMAYARLETILEGMNSGKVPLEDSLKLYEEAEHLIAWCNEQLTKAEKKIEILIKNKEGDLQINERGAPLTQPFGPTSSAPLNRLLTE